MKRSLLLALSVLVSGLASGVVSGCSSMGGGGPGSAESVAALMPSGDTPALGTGVLAEEDTAHVLYMREEEKLARDLYQHFQDRWDHRVFAHIVKSEQRHVSVMGRIVTAYGLTDPLANDVPGKFIDPDLQGLYDQLVTTGDASLAAALGVGALVEEVDIRDLQASVNDGPPEDVAFVYDRLERASDHHLRAFTRNLEALGTPYTPQVLSQADFDAALASAESQGCGKGKGGGGNGMGGGRGR